MSFGFLAAKDFQIIWFFNVLIKSIPDEWLFQIETRRVD
jgi:hypothetical protein